VEDLALVDLVDVVQNQIQEEPFDGVPFQEDDSNLHADHQVLVDLEGLEVGPFVVDLDQEGTIKK
jgi:hypothetical protein